MNLKLILARALQFVTFVLFTFIGLLYCSVFLMVVLAVFWYAIRVVSFIGVPTVIAVFAGIAATAYLGLRVSKMPKLYMLIYTNGLDLIAFGHAQIKRFDSLVEEAKVSTAA